jgi:hypothetical protein
MKPGGLLGPWIGSKLVGMQRKSLPFLLVALALPQISNAAGIQFHEIMRGKIRPANAEPLSLKLDMIANMPDIDAWASDPEHPATLKGTASVDGLIIPVTGTLNLAVPGDDPAGVPGHVLHYTFGSDPNVAPYLHFEGQKFVPTHHRDYVKLVGEITTLIGTATYQLDPCDPVTEADTQVVFPWYDPLVMVPFLASFKISGAHGNGLVRVHVRSKFLAIYFGGLLSTHDEDSDF